MENSNGIDDGDDLLSGRADEEESYATVEADMPASTAMTQLSLVPVFEIPSTRPIQMSPYETYASLFPNPNLNSEIMEREKLLTAISAADHAVSVNPKQSKTSWFSWGSKKQEEEDIVKMDLVDDDRLVYSEPLDETSTFPMAQIEYSAIPVEAHALVRHQMVRNLRFAVSEEGAVDLTDGRLFDVHVNHRATLPNGTCFVASAALVLVYSEESRSPVAQIPPSPAIFQKLAEHFFLQQDDDTALLQIVGLRIISDSILVIARLGGFLEFVNVGGRQEPTIALTTSEYHTDLLGIEVCGETSIVAYGGKLDDDAEVSFEETEEQPSSNSQVITIWKYETHGDIKLLQVIPLDVPPSSVIFSNTSAVSRYWRRPRSVRLRSPEDGPPIQQRSPANVSFPTPIVQVAIGLEQWAVVDGLGGVTIFRVESASGQISQQHDRSTTATQLEMAPVVSAAFDGDLLFLLSNYGELYCWHDGSSIHVSPYARCLIQSRPVRIVLEEPDTTKIVTLQTSVGTDTIGMLIQTGNVQQALSIGKHLGSPDLEMCRKDSWLEFRDLSILSDVKDTAYIIQQAMAPVDMTLKLYRDVCRLAITRIETARLGELVSFAASAEDAKDISDSLRKKTVSCGTYELLCAQMEYEPTLIHFLEDFFTSSMQDLAQYFASVGDMASLSLILFRHPSTNILEVLDRIPLATDPAQFGHLIPCPHEKEHNDYFISHEGQLGISELCAYIESLFCISVALQDCDLEALHQQQRCAPRIDRIDIEGWFENRANALSSFLGSVSLTNKFTEMALVVLKGTNASESDVSAGLVLLHQFTDMICTMTANEGDSITSPLTTMNPNSLRNMSTRDLISMVLTGSTTDSVNIQRRYIHLLLPLLELRHADLKDVDNDVAAACLEACTYTGDILAWMRQSVELLRASRLSVDDADRIIKDPVLCFDSVLGIATQTFSFAKGRPLSGDDIKTLVDLLWQIYECLPERSTSWLEPNVDNLQALSSRADQLYIDLIALELCTGWSVPSTDVFENFPIYFGEPLENQELITIGHSIASLMCKSLCRQLSSSTIKNGTKAALSTLMGDLKELNRLCFQETLDLQKIVYNSLARPFLLAHQIVALGFLFELAGSAILDPAQLSDEVLTLYNAAVYGDESSEDEIRAAAQFRDVLGCWMPAIVDDFSASGKFLDASHMVSKILDAEQNGGALLPKDIRRMRPLEVIDHVMMRNPSCFIQHSPEWSDEGWAATANSRIRQHFEGQNDIHFAAKHHKQSRLPPLPGIPVFRLAELIGLDNSTAIIEVKARIIYYGANAGIFGASAAVCRTLIADTQTVSIDSLAALEATALIVSSDGYQDIETKKELCIASLHLRNKTFSHRKALAVGNLIRSFECFELDWTSNWLFENGTLRQMSKDIQADYSTSLFSLLSSLQRQMCNLVFDDDLLVILARYTFFWCIGRATKPLMYPCHPFYSIATESAIKVASALSIHVEEPSKFEKLYNEINATFSAQTKNAAEYSSTGSQGKWIAPDSNLVARLVDRGYSECGARRAVAMTNSAGFDIAVRWAVQHSMDDNFDEPDLVVRSVEETRIDDDSVRLCQAYLAQLPDCRLQRGKFQDTSKCSVHERSIDGSGFDEGAWSDDDGFDFDDQQNDEELKATTSDETSNDVAKSHDTSEGVVEDPAIVGGWDDRDEIGLDAGLDEVHNNSGWDEDDVDLNTILEGEHETSELMNTPIKGIANEKDMNTRDNLPDWSQKVLSPQNDTPSKPSPFFESQTNTNLVKNEQQDTEHSGWDDTVDFEDFSDRDDDHGASEATNSKPDNPTITSSGNLESQKVTNEKGMMSSNESEHPSTSNLILNTEVTKASEIVDTSKTVESKQQESGLANLPDLAPSTSIQGENNGLRACTLPMPPKSAPLPRSKLLEVGQAAFASARKISSPSHEERQRLIEQGRAFLKQIKSPSSTGSLKRNEAVHPAFFSDSHRARSAPNEVGESAFEV